MSQKTRRMGGWLRQHPFADRYIPSSCCSSSLTVAGILYAAWISALSLVEAPARADMYGPVPLFSSEPLVHSSRIPVPWWSSAPLTPFSGRPYDLRSRLWTNHVEEEETIERVSGEEKGPRIPEPMVFDLVRPLGAKRGEGEANVLGIIPLGRKSRTVDDAADPLGLVRRSPDTRGLEWAPEIEYTVRDGLAIEFELPMENATVEAYKAAGQASFGTLWDDRFIHGTQVIAQYDRDPGLWTTTWLYLAGYRFDETWSIFGMFGPRFEHGSQIGGRNTEILSNITVFADITERLVAGLETNFGQVIQGSATLLVMPQVHYEVGLRWMVQSGVGFRVTTDVVLPEVGFRFIREF